MANSIMKRARVTSSKQYNINCTQEAVTVAVEYEDRNTQSLVEIVYLELRVECFLRI